MLISSLMTVLINDYVSIGLYHVNWSRGQTEIYGLFCEFVASQEEKTWLLFSVRDMSWGLRNACFTKFSVVKFL